MIFLLKLFVSMRNEEATASSCLNVATGLRKEIPGNGTVEFLQLSAQQSKLNCLVFEEKGPRERKGWTRKMGQGKGGKEVPGDRKETRRLRKVGDEAGR